MAIASRTPEGEPAECPLCGTHVRVEPSLFFSDAPCPACGALLWFVRLGAMNVLVPPTEHMRQDGLNRVLAELLGMTESELQNDPTVLETLELVQLVMELEDQMGK